MMALQQEVRMLHLMGSAQWEVQSSDLTQLSLDVFEVLVVR